MEKNAPITNEILIEMISEQNYFHLGRFLQHIADVHYWYSIFGFNIYKIVITRQTNEGIGRYT